ncbi:MAG TPA: hypothetical protein VFC73_07520 [Syntrophomonadaceae bacterium]|nr:hypothetical protein [Syntrophomonadaceae bacterium]
MARHIERKIKLVENFTGLDLIVFAAEHYGPEYSNVMKGKLSTNLDNVLRSCYHNRDTRSNLQYGQDLILGWILEDFIIDRLQAPDIIFTKTGADAERKFLSGSKVTTDSDYKISLEGKQFFVELAHDFNLFWQKREVYHLRDNKLLSLIKKSEKVPTFILGISIVDRKCILKRIHKNMNKEYIEFHPPYKKPAYEIPMPAEEFYNFDDFNLRILLGK